MKWEHNPSVFEDEDMLRMVILEVLKSVTFVTF